MNQGLPSSKSSSWLSSQSGSLSSAPASSSKHRKCYSLRKQAIEEPITPNKTQSKATGTRTGDDGARRKVERMRSELEARDTINGWNHGRSDRKRKAVEYSGNILRRDGRKRGSNGLAGHFLGFNGIYYNFIITFLDWLIFYYGPKQLINIYQNYLGIN